MKDIKVLIVPDVHGRVFWRQPVLETLKTIVKNDSSEISIVFLGDYLSPYTAYEGITDEQSIEVFKEILELAKVHKNIKLLIGNHDGSVIGPDYVCRVRLDTKNKPSNQKLFIDNKDLFDICYETTINGKKFLLSHAGYLNSWLNKYADGYFEGVIKNNLNLADFLNNKFHLSFENDSEYDDFWYVMSDVDFYRGGYIDAVPSIIWTDLRKIIFGSKNLPEDVIQVVGHTILNNKAVNYKNKVYCLDCLKCFYIDSKGDIRYYDNDKIVEENK